MSRIRLRIYRNLYIKTKNILLLLDITVTTISYTIDVKKFFLKSVSFTNRDMIFSCISKIEITFV